MTLQEELAQVSPSGESLVSIGVFDGVHLGHQKMLSRLRELARERGLLSGVITFNIHPLAVLAPQNHPTYLTSLEERLERLRGLGVDFIVTLTFTRDLASMSAREFMEALALSLKLRGLVVGPDFSLGRNREGVPSVLEALGRETGFTVEVVPPLTLGGQMVSSTAIRQALARGDMATAAQFLGRPFSLRGPVAHGVERGHLLGYPTANLAVDSHYALPPDGVYAARAQVWEKSFGAAAYIGRRPTFGEKERTVEAFLLDFQGDLYGQEMRLELLERLRPDRAFATAGELQEQIKEDVARIRTLLREAHG